MEEFWNNTLSVERQKEIHEYINKRWKQLNELAKESTESCINYLFYCNGGGIIACFGVMSRQEIQCMFWVKLCGSLFLLGLIFVGILRVIYLNHIVRLQDNWIDKADEHFFKQKISFHTLNKLDKAIVDDGRIPLYFLGYTSLAFFVSACIIGIYFSFK